jgi:hypothetical protein
LRKRPLREDVPQLDAPERRYRTTLSPPHDRARAVNRHIDDAVCPAGHPPRFGDRRSVSSPDTRAAHRTRAPNGGPSSSITAPDRQVGISLRRIRRPTLRGVCRCGSRTWRRTRCRATSRVWTAKRTAGDSEVQRVQGAALSSGRRPPGHQVGRRTWRQVRWRQRGSVHRAPS